MLFRLNEPLRSQLIHKLDLLLYDIIFAINGGISADPDAGFWAADKYAKWRGKPNLGRSKDGH